METLDVKLEVALKKHRQWFGSYKKSGDLKKVQVWLTVNEGRIEFMSAAESYKVKRARRNPQVVCFIGSENGPSISGTAEIVTDKQALWRTYRAYWKTHPLGMLLLFLVLRSRIKSGTQVQVRVRPDEPNPLAGVSDPEL